MYPLKIVIFHSDVSLPEGIFKEFLKHDHVPYYELHLIILFMNEISWLRMSSPTSYTRMAGWVWFCGTLLFRFLFWNHVEYPLNISFITELSYYDCDQQVCLLSQIFNLIQYTSCHFIPQQQDQVMCNETAHSFSANPWPSPLDIPTHHGWSTPHENPHENGVKKSCPQKIWSSMMKDPHMTLQLPPFPPFITAVVVIQALFGSRRFSATASMARSCALPIRIVGCSLPIGSSRMVYICQQSWGILMANVTPYMAYDWILWGVSHES